jgi:predicted nucleic acid-binding protein
VIVVDASIVLEVLLRSDIGRAAEERLFRPGESIHVPALIDVEVAQVLRRYVASGQLTAPRARASVAIAAAFPMVRYTHEPLLQRIWELRENLTAYDAAYVALAEGLRAPLVTCDARLARAPGPRAVIELL